MGESAMPFADAFPLPKWPYLNLGNLERVEHVHCDRVSSLVRQMPTDATPQTLERLPGIDRLAVVVVEQVHAPFAVANPFAVVHFGIHGA